MKEKLTQMLENDEICLMNIFITFTDSCKLLEFWGFISGVLAGALGFLLPNTYDSVLIARFAEGSGVLCF
jgi:hypothetical protein